MSKPVILTGLRTNAEYHLGNYLGAILPMVELQKQYIGQYQINMFAPDLHSFTTEVEHGQLYRQTLDNLKVFIASGMPIEHEDFYLYRQSFVPAHSELTVILNNFAYFGELSRMTQFKEKSKLDLIDKEEFNMMKQQAQEVQNLLESGKTKYNAEEAYPITRDSLIHMHRLYTLTIKREEVRSKVTAGLLDYPVLMAADILLYGAKYVPVGEDQRQHLELTRDLAIRMNNKFGELFTVPEPWDKQLAFAETQEGVRIRSLKHPDKKMSKSVDDPAGTILLSDSPNEAKAKVMSATTDNEGKIEWDWVKQPGVTNLLQILQLLGGASHDEVLGKWQGRTSYGELKSAVAESVAGFLSDFQAKLGQVDNKEVESKLESSETAMAEAADQTLAKVQTAVGLRP